MSIGVACAKEVESLWIIFFSIMRLPASYGMLSSVVLGYPRVCLVWWMICLLAGGLVDALRVLSCGS
jgi:hypothetical protein